MATPLVAFTTALDGAVDAMLDGCRKVTICEPLPPPVLAAELTEVRVGAAGITLNEIYAEGNLATPPTLARSTGEWPGRLITYRAEFQGLEEFTCSVRWTLYDAATGRRIPSPTSGWRTTHVTAFPDGSWIVEARQTDVIVGLIWVPYVEAGTFVVEVELLDPEGLYLDIERTGPFDVAAEDIPAP